MRACSSDHGNIWIGRIIAATMTTPPEILSWLSVDALGAGLSLVDGFAGRKEYALQRVKTLLDLPERNLDRIQAFLEADVVGAEIPDVGADVVDAGVHASDLH